MLVCCACMHVSVDRLIATIKTYIATYNYSYMLNTVHILQILWLPRFHCLSVFDMNHYVCICIYLHSYPSRIH